MPFPAHILIIDDDEAYARQLAEAAKAHRLLAMVAGNLEEGIGMLEKSPRVMALVLDDHCLLEPGDLPTEASPRFLIKAMDQINRIELEQDRHLPFCVCSKTPGRWAEMFEGTAAVFSRNEPPEAMFAHLRRQVENLPVSGLMEKHDEVFLYLLRYGSGEEHDLLVQALQNSHKTDASAIATNLAMLRRLLEMLIDNVMVQALGTDPRTLDCSGQSHTKAALQVLKTRKLLPRFLNDMAYTLYSTASQFGNHSFTGKGFVPRKYTVQSLLCSYCELVLWASGLMENIENGDRATLT
mgnify:CR=1 FL=1